MVAKSVSERDMEKERERDMEVDSVRAAGVTPTGVAPPAAGMSETGIYVIKRHTIVDTLLRQRYVRRE